MENVPRLEKTVIYIRLLDEGVPVTRPIYAEILGDNIFRILPTENYGSLGIAVIFPHLGAKSASWRKTPPYMGGTTATPNEAKL